MVFASMTFLWIFLPATLILYGILSRIGKQEIQNLLLLFASVLFYSFGEPKYVLLLLISGIVNYLCGLGIGRTEGGRKKAVLALAVILNLGALGYFKYFDFLAASANALAGRELISVRNIALPIGISFYTFQAMSYLIDLYRGKCGLQTSLYRLLLYITFFPQLIAGPIVRYRDVAEQIDCRRTDLAKWSEGVTRFIIGLSKKVILANTFASKVDLVFAMDGARRGTLAAWYGVFLYALQIYFDFSGYSDMAIGLGKMFGFDFLENFRLPYTAASVREFWRRWHISLSTWFREYLYIPLGGSRKGTWRTYRNLILVFAATGIWHGAGWNFLIWGLFHGAFLVAERVFLGECLEKNPVRILNHIYCLLVVLIAWVFFRAETMGQAVGYLGSMFRIAGGGQWGFLELFGKKCICLSAAGVLLSGVIPEKYQLRLRNNGLFRALALPCLLFLCIMLLAADSYNPFIYFRF